ncbi:MAG: hypothetical protein KGD73_03790 [Candidatus Lokiarchaeota archaeon]|nr:hypothetical protein [Candidatus Lokiarchaeota archaeon]
MRKSTSLLNFTDTHRLINSGLGYAGHFDEDHVPHIRIDYIICSPNLLPTTSEVFCSLSPDHCSVRVKWTIKRKLLGQRKKK